MKMLIHTSLKLLVLTFFLGVMPVRASLLLFSESDTGLNGVPPFSLQNRIIQRDDKRVGWSGQRQHYREERVNGGGPNYLIHGDSFEDFDTITETFVLHQFTDGFTGETSVLSKSVGVAKIDYESGSLKSTATARIEAGGASAAWSYTENRLVQFVNVAHESTQTKFNLDFNVEGSLIGDAGFGWSAEIYGSTESGFSSTFLSIGESYSSGIVSELFNYDFVVPNSISGFFIDIKTNSFVESYGGFSAANFDSGTWLNLSVNGQGSYSTFDDVFLSEPRSNIGSTSVSVPEPQSIYLAILSLLGLVIRRQNNRKSI